jgi:Protein of unknown function (DUF2721)
MSQEILKFNLPNMLGIAVSMVALIIASSIFFQCLTTKYIAIVERYRNLTGEYRGGHSSPPRHGSLHEQIEIYKQQLHCLTRASTALAVAILVFLVTIATAALSVAMPWSISIKVVSGISLFVGLVLIAVGVCFELWENQLARKASLSELADFEDIPSREMSNSAV